MLVNARTAGRMATVSAYPTMAAGSRWHLFYFPRAITGQRLQHLLVLMWWSMSSEKISQRQMISSILCTIISLTPSGKLFGVCQARLPPVRVDRTCRVQGLPHFVNVRSSHQHRLIHLFRHLQRANWRCRLSLRNCSGCTGAGPWRKRTRKHSV